MKMKQIDKPIIIIRKKIEGENSIEELAYRLSNKFSIDVISMPYHSTKILNILKNIIFLRKIKAPLYYIISPSETYLLPFLKGKKIITYHDLGTLLNSRNIIYRFFKKIIFLNPSKNSADEITFVSEQTKKEYIKIMKVKRDNNLHVIYNSYNPDFSRKEKKQKNDIFTILHVGTADRKNLDNVILACNNINIKLIIIGKLKESQCKLLEESNFPFSNYFDIDTNELIEFYRKADLITFPSSYEGFGMPIIEANVIGTPIIAGDIPVLHEVAGDAAYFVNGKDVKQIHDAIITLMTDKKRNELLINKGFNNSKRFSENVIYQKYKELLGL